jgi:hypothetical protein
MLSQTLAKEFQKQLASEPFFGSWLKEKPRAYWKRSTDLHLSIDLQLDKWWDKDGGKIAVNLGCGHRWTIPTLGWQEEGMDYSSMRLSPEENTDHWWQIRSESDITCFSTDFVSLLQASGIPWFDKVATKEGFLGWYSTIYPHSSTLPYILEIHGRSALIRHLCEWLESAPSGIDRQLKWLVDVGVITADFSHRLRLASIQSVTDYQARIPRLIAEIKEIEQGGDGDAEEAV